MFEVLLSAVNNEIPAFPHQSFDKSIVPISLLYYSFGSGLQPYLMSCVVRETLTNCQIIRRKIKWVNKFSFLKAKRCRKKFVYFTLKIGSVF